MSKRRYNKSRVLSSRKDVKNRLSSWNEIIIREERDRVLEKMNELYNNQKKHTGYKALWDALYKWLEGGGE